jgi:hypothetical protein
MPELNVLKRLERAERTEASAAIGVADELVSLERRRSRLAAILHSVRQQAEVYPRRLPPRDVAPEAWSEAQNARADALRSIRQQIKQTGVDPAAFNEALVLASEPSGADFVQAIAVAEAALTACERDITELEAERSRRGRRLGELRASIRQGQDWLRANGFAAEAV